jgi:hypothetical protein
MTRLLKPSVIAIVAVVAVAASASAATTRGYNGRWPVTVTRSARSNGQYCLTLTGTSRHAGSASLTGPNGLNLPFGTFQVVNRTLVATIQQQGYSQNAGLVFIASASGGNIGQGAFDQVYGGEAFDFGALSFGMRNGC